MSNKGAARAAEGSSTTSRLREVLDRAASVVIVEGAPDEVDATDRRRIVVTGIEIADLAQRLAIVDGRTGSHCLCPGWPTILVHDSHGDLIARWTLHHQSALRGVGDCDADLRDGPGLTEWLAQHGLTGPQKVQTELAAQEVKAEQRRMRWRQAAPVGLAGVAADVAEPSSRDDIGWSNRLQEAQQRLAALVRQRYADEIDRVRILLAWAGIPSREASGGLMWYDLAVQRLLLAEAPDTVLTALTVQVPTAAQLDGAAGLFTSYEWVTAHGRQLPEPVRSILIDHIHADGTDQMRFQLRHGYFGGERSA
ncbi:hypothetical protein [Nocardia sp. NPDC050710]|uniref:hypothetical protein n=1 Tax=Nocardia sp. NPDC050710 TaxID=3157220 RepID=UPI0033C64196